MKPIFKRMLSGMLSLIVATSAVPIISVHAEESTEPYPYTMFAASNGVIYDCGDYQIRYNVLSEWDNYKQVEMEIINPTDETMYNWAFMYNAGGHIEKIWNASIVDNQNCNYVLSCDNNNNIIEAHSSQLIGYIIHSDQTEMNDIVFKNCTEKIVCSEGFELSAERNNSDNTYSLSLKNTSDTDFYGWELDFYTNAEITNFWNAQLINETENSFKLKSEYFNSVLKSGECKSIGFNGYLNEYEELSCIASELNAYIISYNFDDIDNNNNNEDSSENNSDAPVLSVFSEYGVNVLSWESSVPSEYNIYRKSEEEEEFSLIKTLEDLRYFVDENVTEGIEYTYYVSTKINDSSADSEKIVIVTSTLPDNISEEMPEWLMQIMMLEEDYSTVNVIYADGDSSDYVSKNVILSDECINGSTVSWSSSNPEIIDNNGNVSIPENNEIVSIDLIATLKNGSFTIDKMFKLRVIPSIQQESVDILDIDTLMELNSGEETNIIYSSKYDAVREISGICSSFKIVNEDNAYDAVKALSNILGIEDFENEIRYSNYISGSLNDIYRFTSVKNGIPVIGCDIFIHVDKETRFASKIYSNYVPLSVIETTEPELSADEAFSFFSEKYNIEILDEPSLVIYYVNPDDYTNTPYCAWSFEVSGELENIIVDASNGTVLFKEIAENEENNTYTEDNNAILNEKVTINTTSKGVAIWKKYYLHDSIRNIHAKDATGISDKSFAADDVNDYIRKDNDWSDAKYSNAIIAMYNTERTYDYYKNILKWKGYDGSGTPRMYIGVDRNISNASSSEGIISFRAGDGGNMLSYAVDVDTVAHEFTHLVTKAKFNKLGGKAGDGESGALDEALSDIFGEFVDPDHDWTHGDQIRVDGTPGRNLIDPSIDNNPIKYKGVNWGDTSNTHDNGYVHKNSTVLSHAAYLMTTDNSVTGTPGIPIDDLQHIWYNAYDNYSTIEPTFSDCRKAVVYAAEKYSTNSCYVKRVKEAFDEVGIYSKDISFIIVDAGTRRPIKNAKVYIEYEQPFFNGSNIETKNYMTDSSGCVTIKNLCTGNCDVKVEVSGYKDSVLTVHVSDNISNYYIDMESNYNKSLKGHVTIADDDTDLTNNIPLSNANLKLEKLTAINNKLNGTNNFILSKTDTDGNYLFENIPAGEYDLRVMYTGYIETHQIIRVTGSGVTTHNVVIELIPKAYDGLGYASGRITDAKTGITVSGLTLSIYNGIRVGVDKPVSTPVCKITSDVAGKYITDALPAGNYTIYVEDFRNGITEDERYLTSSFIIKVIGDQIIAEQNGSVSTTLEKNQIRIILTWGLSPSDLDSHLYIRSFTETLLGCTNFSQKSFYQDSVKIADLDLDDTTSYGPETTTVYNDIPGMYTFYVHDWTNKNNSASTQLSASGAKVSIYSGSSNIPVEEFSVPDGVGNVWKVFTYNSVTGEIFASNTISNSYL